ncbi:DUF6236 family protein [Micromonospora eburnea]|uniref:Uncharacterized protein n=1 Tax=Micromonospora eburnea TaxID=227316 RepID=A0A1C6UCN1_9ACTN|nr:DUF6236 family protein [Micromonospora eburnea]SCL51671.1 hypothetical protein GA0070604_2405 [Micromonospora eburnea]
MSDVALYYPYINLPGDSWVKAAALHWPQLGRIRPRGYPGLRDSDTVKRLRDELDFVIEVRPGWGGSRRPWVDGDPRAMADRLRLGTDDQVETLFYDFLDRYADELTPRYGAKALGVESVDTWDVYDELLPLDPRLEKVHPSKMSYRLAQRLATDGLLVSQRYQWRRASDGRVLRVGDLAMHSRLAGVYLAILADVVARENGMTPVTDQPLISAVTSGWTIEAMAQILLADDTETAPEGQPDYSQVFAVLALQTVVPRDLAEVPVERIIEARRRLLPQLMRYREFLDSLTPDLVAISGIRDPDVRAAKLRNHVESKVAHPLEEMERTLGRLGLQPVRAVLGLQTLAPPAALGVLANAVHLPPVVTSAGVAALCLVGAVSGALDQRRQTTAGHPAGYLLDLRRELGPSDTVAQIRSAIRRAVPAPRRPTRRPARGPGQP